MARLRTKRRAEAGAGGAPYVELARCVACLMMRAGSIDVYNFFFGG